MSRTILRLAASAALLVAVAARPAAADTHFTVVETLTDEKGNASTFTMEGWESPAGTRLEVRNGTLPGFPAGAFVLMLDEGRSLVLVDPAKESYQRLDQAARLRELGSRLKLTDAKVEKLLDEDGGKILGQKARHMRYRISYRTPLRDPEMSMHAVIEKEVWVATDLQAEGISAWLSTGAIPSGDPEFEKLLAQMRETMKGMPLKMAITSSSTLSDHGKSDAPSGIRFEAEVKSLETAKVDETRLALPKGYREMTAPGGGAPPKHD